MALIACVALPLIGVKVVRIQLGVGRIAGSIGHGPWTVLESDGLVGILSR